MSETAARLERLYLLTPTPEFRMALDLAVNPLNQPGCKSLGVVSSEFYAVELLRRCWQPLDVLGSGSFDSAGWVGPAAAWAPAPLKTPQPLSPDKYSAILWAEPEKPSAAQLAGILYESAAPGASLNIIASTGLRRYLPAWHADPLPAQEPLSASRVPEILRAAGWQLRKTIGFHGPRSMLWTVCMHIAQAVGRPDWADRCWFGVRGNYQEAGFLRKLTPLILFQAERVQSPGAGSA